MRQSIVTAFLNTENQLWMSANRSSFACMVRDMESSRERSYFPRWKRRNESRCFSVGWRDRKHAKKLRLASFREETKRGNRNREPRLMTERFTVLWNTIAGNSGIPDISFRSVVAGTSWLAGGRVCFPRNCLIACRYPWAPVSKLHETDCEYLTRTKAFPVQEVGRVGS